MKQPARHDAKSTPTESKIEWETSFMAHYLLRLLLADVEREGDEGAETRGADGVAERETPALGDEWLTLGALGR